jgi:glycosyltransferase involved in cell wall biosynthesis
MHQTIKDNYAALLSRDDVTVLDYVSDAGALYRSADIFAFPTLEEGAPLVTYEACGCGLPAVTTEMGAARIIANGREGFILDPYDGAGWVAALSRLAEDASLRRTMARAAREAAELFRWELVGARRKRQMLDVMLPSACPSTPNDHGGSLDRLGFREPSASAAAPRLVDLHPGELQ